MGCVGPTDPIYERPTKFLQDFKDLLLMSWCHDHRTQSGGFNVVADQSILLRKLWKSVDIVSLA